jgi:hypothetical protein
MKKKHHKKNKKKKHDVTQVELAVANGEPTERRSRDKAGGALVAALQEAARLGVRVAVDRDGYTLLHGREEERCGKADVSGVVIRRTPARRERAVAAGTA